MLGSSYANAVNNQREKEGKEPDFDPILLWGGSGERVEGSAFLLKKKGSDKLYVAYRLLKVLKETYYQGLKEVNPDDYKDFLPLPPKPSNQDIEKAVVWRTVAYDNVLSVIYDGKDWR